MFSFTIFPPLFLILSLAADLITARHCQNVVIPVTIKTRNAVFKHPAPAGTIETTDFFLQLARQGTNYTQEELAGYKDVSTAYKLGATVCVPSNGHPPTAVQILTHGVGFDRSYWDFPFPNAKNNDKYSYVASAVDQHSYVTLAWDRPGIAQSLDLNPLHQNDPLNLYQVSFEIAALVALTSAVSAGHVPAVPPSARARILHVGHSLGSILTYNLVNARPDLSSGIALTGFSQVPDFLPEFLLGADFVPTCEIPALRKRYSATGYYAPQSQVGVQTNFFAPGGFDPKVLALATRLGQPLSAGEAFTVGLGTGVTNEYAGPVLAITGENDVPFCGGNCFGTDPINDAAPNLVEASAKFFPKAQPFQATIIPNTGHAMNLENSAQTTYSAILDFFGQHLSQAPGRPQSRGLNKAWRG